MLLVDIVIDRLMDLFNVCSLIELKLSSVNAANISTNNKAVEIRGKNIHLIHSIPDKWSVLTSLYQFPLLSLPGTTSLQRETSEREREREEK